MSLEKAFVPYGAYWSSPFCRWQGSLATVSSLQLAACTAERFFSLRDISPETLDGLSLGFTVPQQHSFYGPPWLAGLMGAPGITGPAVAQACATSVRVLAGAAMEVEVGQNDCILGITCDRTSNGPHVFYPNPSGIGGRGTAEDPVWDNFNKDPYAGQAMIQTAENVAQEVGITREEQDEVALIRYQQYEEALANDRAFQKRYLFPLEVGRGKRAKVVAADEGVHPTTVEGLAKLAPALEGGTVTFGTQTHPADGNAGMIVCTKDRADKLSKDPAIRIRVVSFAEARVKKGLMPMAVVPAARAALGKAGIGIEQCKGLKTHNPFAINDVYFCKEMGCGPEQVNRYGSSLIYGHPQGPTGMRGIIELVEQLTLGGGGYGLFSGCAAGDTAMAVVIKVG